VAGCHVKVGHRQALKYQSPSHTGFFLPPKFLSGPSMPTKRAIDAADAGPRSIWGRRTESPCNPIIGLQLADTSITSNTA